MNDEIANILQKIKHTQARLLDELQSKKHRLYLQKIDPTPRGMILIGARGTGKTTWLLTQTQKHAHSIYISLDSLYLQNVSLNEIIDYAYNSGYRNFFLDEVHYKNNWALEVKNAYDAYPKAKFIISDSSSLILRSGTGDLSRRFPKITIPLLSLREYIHLKHDITLPVFNPIAQYKQYGTVKIPAEITEFINKNNIHEIFHQFLKEGQRPFFIEGWYTNRIINIIEKTIYDDIPYFLPSFQKNHLGTLRAIVDHLSTATIPTINIQSLCSQWEIGKDKLYELLKVLEATGVINIIFNTKTPKGSSKGDKIFFQDCSFYDALQGNIGNIRESFFTSSIKGGDLSVVTSKKEEDADYIVENILFEIGGKNKSRKKADIVVQHPLDQFYDKAWPLWGLGFLW